MKRAYRAVIAALLGGTIAPAFAVPNQDQARLGLLRTAPEALRAQK